MQPSSFRRIYDAYLSLISNMRICFLFVTLLKSFNVVFESIVLTVLNENKNSAYLEINIAKQKTTE